jgi:hypothetical protein
MKPWWFAFLIACASEPKPAPVAAPPAPPPKPVAQPEPVDESDHSMVDLLTAEGSSSDGDMTRPHAGADLGQQISEVREGGKSDDPRVGTGMGPGSGKPMAVDPGKPGRISILEKQAFDNTTLTAELVLAKMTSAYIAGIKRCYRAYLKKDPTAKGELVLKLTVNWVGRTVDGKAVGIANEIADCTTGQMAAWRFPIPKDTSGEATTAAFQIKLGLVPE